MKYTILFAMMILAAQVQAMVIEVNTAERKVYVHPRPTIEFSMIDLEAQGSILNVSVDYKNQTYQAESKVIQAQYPGYQIQVVAATVQGAAEVRIPKLHLKESVQMRQGQMGPYFNYQINLNQQDTQQFKKMASRIGDEIEIDIPAKMEWQSVQSLEKFVAEASYCQEFKVSKVGDLMNSFALIRKPKQIKFDSTFRDFKKSVLSQCFSVQPKMIQSFNDLVQTPVDVRTPESDIIGETLAGKTSSKTVMIDYEITTELN